MPWRNPGGIGLILFTGGGGERMNRYVELVFGHKDPFETVDNLTASGILDNALLVFQPLLENLTYS